MESTGVGVISMILGIRHRRITLTASLMSMHHRVTCHPLPSNGRISSSEGGASEQEEAKDNWCFLSIPFSLALIAFALMNGGTS